ncbi:YrdB family protein [Microbacterium panaciterrae]|uniref:DUF2568 domain-containing protein n=1 Tax=Microbacterium panaciterrae TaxID=985759 RepID=A0ABP8PFU6_9MICO
MSADPAGSGAPDPFLDGGPALRTALVVRFLLELALLAGAATAAWRLVPGEVSWLAASATIIAFAVVWGLFLSPKAKIGIPPAGRMCLEIVLFGGVGAALWVTGLGGAGAVLVVIWILDLVALAVLQR